MIHFIIQDADYGVQSTLDLLTNYKVTDINRPLLIKTSIMFFAPDAGRSEATTLLFEYEFNYTDYTNGFLVEKPDMDITTAINFLKDCKRVVKFLDTGKEVIAFPKKELSEKERKMLHLIISDTKSGVQDALNLLTNCNIANIDNSLSFYIKVWFPASKDAALSIKTLLFEYEPHYENGHNTLTAELSDIDIITAIDFLKACRRVLKFLNKGNGNRKNKKKD